MKSSTVIIILIIVLAAFGLSIFRSGWPPLKPEGTKEFFVPDTVTSLSGVVLRRDGESFVIQVRVPESANGSKYRDEERVVRWSGDTKFFETSGYPAAGTTGTTISSEDVVKGDAVVVESAANIPVAGSFTASAITVYSRNIRPEGGAGISSGPAIGRVTGISGRELVFVVEPPRLPGGSVSGIEPLLPSGAWSVKLADNAVISRAITPRPKALTSQPSYIPQVSPASLSELKTGTIVGIYFFSKDEAKKTIAASRLDIIEVKDN